jgi:prevent-host-death family protein
MFYTYYGGNTMTTLTVTQAKAHFLELIRNSDKRLERFLITKEGKPAAVLMNADEFEGWLETLEIMSDKKALKEIRQARKELEQGKGISWKKVVGRVQNR